VGVITRARTRGEQGESHLEGRTKCGGIYGFVEGGKKKGDKKQCSVKVGAVLTGIMLMGVSVVRGMSVEKIVRFIQSIAYRGDWVTESWGEGSKRRKTVGGRVKGGPSGRKKMVGRFVIGFQSSTYAERDCSGESLDLGGGN